MVTKEMQIAAKEMNILLENIVPNEYISKIPQKFRDFLKEIEDKEHIFNIDLEKEIDEQNITEKTKDLITVIYRNYWCNEEEREKIDRILTENEREYQEELRKKYNPDNIFKKQKEENNISSENLSLIEYKPNTIFEKIKNFIKNIFKRLQKN